MPMLQLICNTIKTEVFSTSVFLTIDCGAVKGDDCVMIHGFMVGHVKFTDVQNVNVTIYRYKESHV